MLPDFIPSEDAMSLWTASEYCEVVSLIFLNYGMYASSVNVSRLRLSSQEPLGGTAVFYDRNAT